MKKLLIILLLIPFSLKAQLNGDKLNHFATTSVLSFGITGLTYNTLSKTNLSLPWCKGISLGVGFIGTSLIGHFKEINDKNNGGHYSHADMNINYKGAAIGSGLMFIITIPAIPRDRIPINDVFDMKNDELIKNDQLVENK